MNWMKVAINVAGVALGCESMHGLMGGSFATMVAGPTLAATAMCIASNILGLLQRAPQDGAKTSGP